MNREIVAFSIEGQLRRPEKEQNRVLLNVLLVALLGLDCEFENVVVAEAVRTLEQVLGAPALLAKANLEVAGRENKGLEFAALRRHFLGTTI